MNNVSITGRLVYEPEIKELQSGKKKLPMRLAVNRNDKNKTTDFFNLQAWDNTAEFIAKYFHKGDPIEVTGRLRTDSFEVLTSSLPRRQKTRYRRRMQVPVCRLNCKEVNYGDHRWKTDSDSVRKRNHHQGRF